MKKALAYGGGLIALYLGVVHFQGASAVGSTASGGVSNIIASLQGRAVNTATPVG